VRVQGKVAGAVAAIEAQGECGTIVAPRAGRPTQDEKLLNFSCNTT